MLKRDVRREVFFTMWDEAKARHGLTLLTEGLSILDELGEGTLAAQLSLVVERLSEKLRLDGGAATVAP